MKIVSLFLLLFVFQVINVAAQPESKFKATFIWETVEKYSNNEDIPKTFVFGMYVYQDSVMYNIYRAENKDLSDAVKLNNVPIYSWRGPFSFTDTDVKKDKTYYYYLTAFITPEIESEKSHVFVLEFSSNTIVAGVLDLPISEP